MYKIDKNQLITSLLCFTLGEFALERNLTLIFLVLVLGDWNVRSAASPARLVVQLILVHFMLFFSCNIGR